MSHFGVLDFFFPEGFEGGNGPPWSKEFGNFSGSNSSQTWRRLRHAVMPIDWCFYRGIGMFPKMVVPPNHPFWWVFHYKPSILGYPYFWKHPYRGIGEFSKFHNWKCRPFFFGVGWSGDWKMTNKKDTWWDHLAIVGYSDIIPKIPRNHLTFLKHIP